MIMRCRNSRKINTADPSDGSKPSYAVSTLSTTTSNLLPAALRTYQSPP